MNESHIDSEIAGNLYDGCIDQENSYLHSDLDNADLLQSSEKKTIKKFLLDSELKQRSSIQPEENKV